VVIGPTGRNFAAGMSGGIAYVLDEDGTFAKRCNMAMVDLEPIEAEEDINDRFYHQSNDLYAHHVDVMSDMTRFDAERLRQLVANHARLTGSTQAKALLEDWASSLPKFRKVMPVEYRRALAELAPLMQDQPVLAVAGE
jgi:glutamate synthase (NADPH/NADH) large chain